MFRMEEFFDRFEAWVQAYGPQVSLRTARKYRSVGEDFARRFGHPSYADRDTLRAWHKEISRDAAPSTINRKIASLRALFAFLQDQGARADDPSDQLPMAKVAQRLPRPLPHRSIHRVIESIQKAEDDLAAQDLVIVEVLYGSGLRREEAATLRLGNFQDRGRVRVIGKGDKERLTIMTEPEYRAVRDWVLRDVRMEDEHERDAEFWRRVREHPEQPLFYNATGRPLVSLKDPGHYVYTRWRARAERVGVEGSPHTLRHSFGTELTNGGVDLYTLSRVMGHENVNTTKVYADLNAKGLSAVRNAHTRQADEE